MASAINNFILSRTRLLFWLSFSATNVALFMPSVGSKGEFYNLDIIIHYVMFTVFAGSAFLHFHKDSSRTLVILVAFAFFVALSEFIQEMLIPGRGYEFTDILSGLAGVLSGFLVFEVWKKNSHFIEFIRE